MDWLGRNSEFLSPEAITKAIVAFKEVTADPSYAKAHHDSGCVTTIVHLIKHFKQLVRDENTNSRLAILLGILEPVLMNDNSLEQALHPSLQAMETLLDILRLPANMKRKALDNGDDEGAAKI